MHPRVTFRRRGAARGLDEGFTLVETLVALFVAAVVFAGLTGVLLTALKASALGRQNQQAADFLTRAIEDARTLDFAALGHVSTDLTGDTRIQATCTAGTRCISPGNGLPAEPLHVLTTGAGIPAHRKDVSATEGNRTNFAVWTYVTEIAGQDPTETLRVTAFATWGGGATAHTRSSSTVVTLAQRGLPVPVFSFTSSGSVSSTKAAGARVLYTFTVTNQGAPDRWNISLSGAGASKPWYFAKDVNGNGAYDVGTDTVLTSTDADTIVDTDRLEPNESAVIFMLWDTASTEAASTIATTVRATSSLQSDASVRGNDASVTDTYKELTTTTTITSAGSGGGVPSPAPSASSTASPSPTPAPPATDQAPCSASASSTVGVPSTNGNGNAYTPTTFVLHNGVTGAASGSTTTQSSSLFSAVGVQNGSTLPAYSSDVNAYAGRTSTASSATTASTLLGLSDARQYSEWRYSLPAKTDVAGTPSVLHLWIASSTPGTALGTKTLNTSVFTQAGSATRSSLGFNQLTVTSTCTGFQEVYVPVTLTATDNIATGTVLGVRVGSSSGDLRFAYDTTTYTSTFALGMK